MFKSMTAYGRASRVSSIGRISVEIHCVNRKHLEINNFLPKEFLRFDGDIKKWISTAIGRGQINVKINVVFDKESPEVITPNLPLARQIRNAWEAIAKDLQIKLSDDSLIRLLSAQEEILLHDEDVEDQEKYMRPLHEVIEQALANVVKMKAAEGAILHDDIAKRFAKLAVWIEEIAVKSPTATGRYRQRLLEKIQEVIASSADLDDRITREVCVYAEKIDIAEEITRFRSHLKQVQELIGGGGKSDNQGVGKTLEFMVQELNRETNTIGSKSSDLDVSRIVIDIKTELERIREQIQNIE